MPGISKQDSTDVWLIKAIDALSYLKKRWLYFFLAVLVGAIAGYLYVKHKKPSYTAEISFVLSTDPKGGGGLAGLAAQLGFDGTTSSPDNIFSGDNIIELFKSRTLIGSALQSVIDSTSNQTLLNYIAKKEYGKDYKLLGPFNQDAKTYTDKQNVLYRKIITEVSKLFIVYKKDKKLIFYTISATSTDPNIANYVAKYMLDETSENFIDTKTKSSATSVRLLKHEADSLAGVLGHTFSSAASLNDRSYNLNPSVTVQRSGIMFNQAKSAAFSAAYTEVMRNLEISKINLQKETPLYKIIDEPELPLPPIKSSTLLYVLAASAISLLLMAAILTAIFLYKSPTNINDNYKQ